jgi:hypothetical protein
MHHLMARLAARVLAPALILLMVVPATAAAFDFTSPPATGPITATLPVLGSSLTVDVATDGAGNLASVALSPIGDFTATALHPNAVRFENAGGTVKVTITSWGGNTSLAAQATSLADIEGARQWAADLFGVGGATTVMYTVGHDGAGAPTIAITDVNHPVAITATVGTPMSKTSDGRSSTKVGITFGWHGFTKRLTIGVTVNTNVDKTSARLQVSLSGRSKQELTGALADVLGSHTWKGTLCDGTAIGIAFQVVDDGTGNGKVTFDQNTFATGAAAHAKTLKKGEGFVAIFDGKHAAVLVWLKKASDGTWKLVVGSFAGHWCKGTTIANPTVNTPVAPDATKDHAGTCNGWDFWGFGRRDGDRHDGSWGKR